MFLNPLMLAGLGAAVLPVVLHLLSRARFRELQWGAMMFLGEQHRRHRHVARLKQLVLLVLRVGTIAAVAVAMARPVVRKAGAVLSEEGRISAVIVLDRSASMGYEENGRSRFDEAKRAVLNVLANLRRGDEAALILMGGGAGDEAGDEAENAPPQPGTDLQAIAQRVGDLRPGYGKADLGAALTQAQRVLDNERNRNREVYVIADRQAATWASVTPPVQQAWRTATHDELAPVRLFFIPVGGEESDNAAIESIEVLGPPLVRDATASVEVGIRNYGSTPRPAMPLVLSVGSRELAKTTVNLAANSSATVTSTVKFPLAGSQVLNARISGAGMRGDDQLDTAIDVREPLRVQLITGSGSSGGGSSVGGVGGVGVPPSENPEQFLRLALAPYATSGEGGSADPAIVTVSAPDRWPALSPERTDVVILSALAGLTRDQVRDLEEFVYAGGGLIVATGPSSRLPVYNALLYRGGTGMLPAELRAMPDGTPPTKIASLDLTHPVFQFLRGTTNPAPGANIARFVAVDTHGGGSDTRVLGIYAAGGAPFLLERPYGRGRVVLVTSSLDASWNALPLSGFFLPFVQSLARYVAVPEQPNRNLAPGQSIDASFTLPGEDASVTLTLPSGATRGLDLIPTGDRYEVHYAATKQPGRYTLRLRSAASRRPDQVLQYVVRSPRDESDLTPLARARWPVLSEAMGVRIVEPDKDAIVGAISSARTGRELHLAVLAAAGAMALLELALTRLWSGEM
jgi:Mg-chelatase subunit ChlD